jgi:hypothetical protein
VCKPLTSLPTSPHTKEARPVQQNYLAALANGNHMLFCPAAHKAQALAMLLH